MEDTLRLPRLEPGDDDRYADHARSGHEAARAADLDADAPLTRFDTIAHAAPHLKEDDLFGVIGHDLDHPSRLHTHDYLEITHAIRGTVLVWVEGETFVLEEGGTILVKPGARHLISPIIEDGRVPLEADVLVRPALFEMARRLGDGQADGPFLEWLDDSRQSACFLAAGRHQTGQAALSRMLIAYCRDGRYRPDLAVMGNLCELFHAAAHVLGQRAQTDPLIGAILDAIAADPAAASNDGIAASLGYSVGYLSRYARKHGSKTLGRLINEERLRMGAELLVTTDRTIAEIAHTVGYESAAYFHKLFRERYQTTPDRYRNDFRIALGRQ
ncbi:AraC family transcriptional regulator [Bifidobacterium miconisargentati]|uniref:AraC family transcriptional regulator n=1 Tax=Bifidobacterium miconisargentati TaxID=2834437 RepID=UPI001BDD8C97|nr:AraC family transcriptional regulator [Bifidobacterium miconisargentati]MBW3090018.1 AraC family transcriptional regulator [Bifidobacterium miconisargentati]